MAAPGVVQPYVKGTHRPATLALGSKLYMVEWRQPMYSHESSSTVAAGRKLTAVESVHPVKILGHEPSSYVASETKAGERLFMQPPMIHVPSSTTAKSR